MKKVLKKILQLLGLVVLLLPLMVIGIVYTILKINIFNNPDFWYGYMAYFGTVSLSVVSIWQTQKSYDVSNRMLKIEEDRLLPFVEINRERSSVKEINDKILKVELCITNYSEYPIHNIYLSKDKLEESTLDKLYTNSEIDDVICSQLADLTQNKASENYFLTTIAGLREISITHHKKSGDKVENLHNSEQLYFNVDMESTAKPITLFMYMQNVIQDVFEQETKIYIVKRKDGKFILTMHSKKISSVGENGG